MKDTTNDTANPTNIGKSLSFYDGWFSFRYCSLCGKKTWEYKEVCPNCGAILQKEN